MLRIGFRPTAVPPTAITAGATERIRIVAYGAAVTLATVNVRDRETCRVSADTGLAVARVWEEARKAMLSSQLSAEGAPLVAQWIEYDRVLDSAARYVRQQRIRTSRNPTTHAFRSAPASLLDTAGYIVADSSGTTYYLPDAEVLLSSMFTSTHCFRLAGAAEELRGSDRRHVLADSGSTRACARWRGRYGSIVAHRSCELSNCTTRIFRPCSRPRSPVERSSSFD